MFKVHVDWLFFYIYIWDISPRHITFTVNLISGRNLQETCVQNDMAEHLVQGCLLFNVP